MATYARIVTQDTVFQWDGASQRLPRGQVIDVPAGSALEKAIGAGRLAPLGATAAQPPAEAPQGKPEAEEKTAPAKPKAVKTQDSGDGKDGEP